jgi:hypothetical protein
MLEICEEDSSIVAVDYDLRDFGGIAGFEEELWPIARRENGLNIKKSVKEKLIELGFVIIC